MLLFKSACKRSMSPCVSLMLDSICQRSSYCALCPLTKIERGGPTIPGACAIEFSTLLYTTPIRKEQAKPPVLNFIFHRAASLAIFERQMGVASSRLYCCSTVVGLK